MTPREALEKAIHDYHRAANPGELVTAWVLVSHRVSDDMDTDGSSVIGRLAASGQRFHVTRGLLDVALTSERLDQ